MEAAIAYCLLAIVNALRWIDDDEAFGGILVCLYDEAGEVAAAEVDPLNEGVHNVNN